MPEYIPPKPSGSGREARFMQAIWDKLWGSGKLIPSSHMKMCKTSRGISLEAAPVKGNGKAADSATRYRVKSVQGDYLTCHAMDGTNENTEDVFVARPPHLRHSMTSQAVDGVTVNYSNYTISGGICKRTATATGYDEQEEMVVPVYQLGVLADAEILAVKPIGGTGVSTGSADVEWLDINIDARAWCHPKVEDEVTSASG